MRNYRHLKISNNFFPTIHLRGTKLKKLFKKKLNISVIEYKNEKKKMRVASEDVRLRVRT